MVLSKALLTRQPRSWCFQSQWISLLQGRTPNINSFCYQSTIEQVLVFFNIHVNPSLSSSKRQQSDRLQHRWVDLLTLVPGASSQKNRWFWQFGWQTCVDESSNIRTCSGRSSGGSWEMSWLLSKRHLKKLANLAGRCGELLGRWYVVTKKIQKT